METSIRNFFPLFFLGLLFSSINGIPGTDSANSAFASDILPRILNGEPTDEFPAVGIVGSIDDGGFCTGTLITRRHVLTAAHCAEFIGQEANGTFELAGKIYFTRSITIHPAYNPVNLLNDVAVLELDSAVPDVDPMPLFRETPIVGELLTIVGFGGLGDASGSDSSFGIQTVGQTEIEEVSAKQIFWVFDSVTESNTAPGDSGGPGFLLIDGTFYVATVTSGGTNADGSLGDRAVNVRVDAYADWIDGVTGSDDFVDESNNSDPIPSEDLSDDGDLSNAPDSDDLSSQDEQSSESQEQPSEEESSQDGSDDLDEPVRENPADSPIGCFFADLKRILYMIVQWWIGQWQEAVLAPLVDAYSHGHSRNIESKRELTPGRSSRSGGRRNSAAHPSHKRHSRSL